MKLSALGTNVGAERGGLLEEQLAVCAPRLLVLEDGARALALRPAAAPLVAVLTCHGKTH